MKRPFLILAVSFLILIINDIDILSQPDLQSGKLIPVYPGSALKTEFEEGDSKICCSFITGDSFDKVVGFYESALQIKALDPDALASKMPFLKQMVDEMKKQMPAGMRIKFFVLKEVEFQGQKGAELFEVVYTGHGKVEYEINTSQLVEKDAHYDAEWNEKVNPPNTADSYGAYEAKLADPELLKKAMPSSPPSGFAEHREEARSDRGYVENTYRKLYKKATFSEGDNEDHYYFIYVNINDMSQDPDLTSTGFQASDGETAVKVKGKYAGFQYVDKSGSFCMSFIRFMVKNKYAVEIRADSACDYSLINQVIDKMNLEALPD